jgi:hypothetical protein
MLGSTSGAGFVVVATSWPDGTAATATAGITIRTAVTTSAIVLDLCPCLPTVYLTRFALTGLTRFLCARHDSRMWIWLRRSVMASA